MPYHKHQPHVEKTCAQCGRKFLALACYVRYCESRGITGGRFCSVKCAGDSRTGTITLARFESNYIPEPNSGCWLWTGPVTHSFGYGKLGHSKRKYDHAHVISYRLYKGVVPAGFVIRHRCDNPYCVNPDHLTVGTVAQNMGDMVRRGRSLKGQRNQNSKFTEADVTRIKLRLLSGDRQKDIALDYGVYPSAIQKIQVGECWRHTPWPEGSGVGPDGIRRQRNSIKFGNRSFFVPVPSPVNPNHVDDHCSRGVA